MPEFFASGPRATENLISAEVASFGAENVSERGSGVRFHGDIEVGYRSCLWSRIASRIFVVIAHGEADTYDDLYAQCRSLPWNDHFGQHSTISVSCTKARSRISNTKHASLVAKDAIVDFFRDTTGKRPNVDVNHPDIRIRVHLDTGKLEVSVDLSGEPLHKRAYRSAGGEAPLKENVAAAMLARARWESTAADSGAFVDPMCGSGTLLIEAAMAAGDAAPGLQRTEFGFTQWYGHRPTVWESLLDEARDRREAGRKNMPDILGFDVSSQAIRIAEENIAKAEFAGAIQVRRAELQQVGRYCSELKPGLLATNPPYGKRLGSDTDLEKTYQSIGKMLLSDFGGWRASVLTSEQILAKAIGLRAWHVNTLYNGPMKCTLAHFEIHAQRTPPSPDQKPSGASMIVNRLEKNLKWKSAWAEKNGVSCYRLYDADMPEYSAAVDVYEDTWIHVQEYAAPPTVDPARAAKRFRELTDAVRSVLKAKDSQIFIKKRMRQRGTNQYGRQAETGVFYEVNEGNLAFLVNFTDYLDTGLFLDHRITRDMVRERSKDRDVLNLFSYTGSFSVYAANGGAKTVTNVDLSNTYLAWAEENMTLNGYAGKDYTYEHADCTEWLRSDSAHQQYDVVIIDPPTFSNSKAMKTTFDVQRDHADLIHDAMRVTKPGGMVFFSTPKRKFKIDANLQPSLDIEDITAKTIPEDFDRRLPHHTFLIQL